MNKYPPVPYIIDYANLYFDELLINREDRTLYYYDFIHGVACNVGEQNPACDHIDMIKYINKTIEREKEVHKNYSVTKSVKINRQLENMRYYFVSRLIRIANLPPVDIHNFSLQQKIILNFIANSDAYFIPTFYTTAKFESLNFLEDKYDLVAKLLSQTWNFDFNATSFTDTAYSVTINFIQPIEAGRQSAEIFLPTTEMISLLKENVFSKYSFLLDWNFPYNGHVNFRKV